MRIVFDLSFTLPLLSDYKRVAADVAVIVREMVPGTPPHGERDVACEHLTDPKAVPRVVWPSHSRTQHRVQLANIDIRDYTKLVYQLSHELAHVMMDPSRDNGAIEMLAVAVSLKVLDEMTEKWKTNAPYPTWSNYAGNFAKYRTREVVSNIKELPTEIQAAANLADWPVIEKYLVDQRVLLEIDPCNRPLNTLGALYLMANGLKWTDLLGIASRTTSNVGSVEIFDGKAVFPPDAIPDWLAPIWAPQ